MLYHSNSKSKCEEKMTDQEKMADHAAELFLDRFH